MARTRIDLAAVIDAAVELVDRSGIEALTLTNVADELEVRPSALYTHVDNVRHLHYVVAVTATTNLTATVRDAALGVAGDRALRSVATAYRRFAAQHPGQYAATLAPPTVEDEDLRAACAELLEVLAVVLRNIGLPERDAAGAAVSMRSMLHGFLALQPVSATDVDDHFEHVVGVLVAGLGSDGRTSG